MELWQILVALIQGLVEWLPISSEGQAVLFVYNTSSVPADKIVSVVVWLHLGTALAVVARYPRDFINVLGLRDRVLLRRLLIATIATALTGIPLYLLVRETISSFNGEIINVMVGALLLVTAVVLYLPTRVNRQLYNDDENADECGRNKEYNDPDEKRAGLTGLVQGLSILPGLSRSGVTISALLLMRVDRERALWFSFLMSVPAVVGALFVDILTSDSIFPAVPLLDLLVMEAIVFVTGLLSMEALLRLARRVDFWRLCVILGAVAIVFGIPSLLA